MKYKRSLIICLLALGVATFAWGFSATRQDRPKDKQLSMMVDYKIKGNTDPLPGQSIPSSWGRLVNYVFDPNNSDRKLFVFEADDGTIRLVRMNLDWDKHQIDEAQVMTIGRK